MTFPNDPMLVNGFPRDEFDFDTPNKSPLHQVAGADPAKFNLTQGSIKGLRFMVDRLGRMWAHGVVLLSPSTIGGGLIAPATVQYQADNTGPGIGLTVNAYLFLEDGAVMRTLQAAYQIDANLDHNAAAVSDIGYIQTEGAYIPVGRLAAISFRQVSAINTANAGTFDIRNLNQAIQIYGVCSAGTATLTVESSTDSVNWLTIDSVAAAGTQSKLYFNNTGGTTLALCPHYFRYLRVTMGTAGAGNTTTLYVGVK